MESEIRLENLEEFKSITRGFEEKYGVVSLEEFLSEISLVSDVEEYKNNDSFTHAFFSQTSVNSTLQPKKTM